MKSKLYFEYGEKEINFLKSKDLALAGIIDEIGYIQREVIPDMFIALLNAIIGQQISTKAHVTIWARFQSLFVSVSPEQIHSLAAESIQACGISMKKAMYIKEIAGSVLDGRLDLTRLKTMDDTAVFARLNQIKGVGTWTAEMLMMFSMQRQDILSWGDLGIQRGLRMLHRHRKITPQLFAKYKRRYSPYSTIASFYLWELSARKCEGHVDNASKTDHQKKQI